MNRTQTCNTSLSYLRLLTNPIINEEVAGVLLEDADMEKILDIQAVMIIGMIAEEAQGNNPFADPQRAYSELRANLPRFEDHQEEIQYILQPDYRYYLQMGMEFLSLS